MTTTTHNNSPAQAGNLTEIKELLLSVGAGLLAGAVYGVLALLALEVLR